MGKAISKDLYYLIQSLSKAEKRNFKLFVEANNDKGAIYIDLFDAIDQQKDKYDEARIVKKIKDLQPAQLSNQKNYLYKQIIKSIRFFQNDTSSEIEELLFKMKFLYSKGLFDQCKKYLNKITKISIAKEKFDILLETLQWERHLLQQEPYSEKRSRKLNEVYTKEQETLAKQKNIVDFQALSANFNNFLLAKSQKDQNAQKEIEKIVQSPLLSNPEKALTNHARFFFYNINAVYYYSKGDLKKSHEFFRANMLQMKSSEESKKENIIGYLSVLNNYASICSTLKKYQALEEVIIEMKSLLQDTSLKLSEKAEIGIFIRAYGQELIWYNNTAQVDKAKKLVEEIETELKKYKSKIEAKHLVMIHYHIFLYHFLTQSYAIGQKWLNNVLSETKSDTFQELNKVALILNMINQFELSNRDLIGYFYTSIQRHQQKEKLFSDFEMSLADSIRKINKIGYLPDQRKAFAELKNKHENNIDKEVMLRYFDILSWLEAKAENISFAKVIEGKNK